MIAPLPLPSPLPFSLLLLPQLLNVLTKKGSSIAVKEMRKLMVAMDYIKNQSLINSMLGKEHGVMRYR